MQHRFGNRLDHGLELITRHAVHPGFACHSMMCAKTRDVTTRAPCPIRCSDNLFIAQERRGLLLFNNPARRLDRIRPAVSQATAGTTNCRT
jgi:hypothetical protein